MPVEAAISAALVQAGLRSIVVLARGCCRFRVVLFDALEPVDDPQLVLKLFASFVSLAHAPGCRQYACARMTVRSARVT